MENHTKIIKDIKALYLDDTRVIMVGFSNGKDSTVALAMVLEALMEIDSKHYDKKVYIVHSDTRLEIEPTAVLADKVFDNLYNYIEKYNLPVKILRVEPELKNRYWSLFLGKGYLLPTQQGRWCTSRLKVDVSEKAINKILEDNKEGFIAITGVRRDESNERNRSMIENSIEDSILKKHNKKGCSLYAPIEHFKTADVWRYLYSCKAEWLEVGGLGIQYAQASGYGDECRTLLDLDGEDPQCSKSARFGCWTCTLRKDDKMLNNMSKEYTYLSKMEALRKSSIIQQEQKKIM